jgi:DHA2 family multidrug resistance protein
MAVALHYMTHLDLQMSFVYAARLRFFQSLGLAFLFVPINTLIYVGIPPGKNNDVSGLSNLARNIGGSAGTSFFTTVLARHQQVHQQYLVQHVFASGPAYQEQIRALGHRVSLHSGSSADTQSHALLQIYQSLQAQASILSYIDVLTMLSIFCACMIPLVFLMKKPPGGTKAAVH